MKKPAFQRLKLHLREHRKRYGLALLLLAIGYYFCLPRQLFKDPLSTVLLDRNGELLGAKIADDGQWRFPLNDSVPEKFKRCIIAFEDKRFYYHIGFDPLAFVRAMRLNIKHRAVVSGGSTLHMQVIRLSRKGKGRTILEKAIEIVLATRLNLRHSKRKVMALYASNAPFGGNVVGLDAAAWKYYGRAAHKLSWAEMAALAVLPNSPALVHPGRNRDVLRAKRDALLDKLKARGDIDAETCDLSKLEPLPGNPKALPQLAPHLLERAQAEGQGKSGPIESTIDTKIQALVLGVAERHQNALAENGIFNMAILVCDVNTREVLAYMGNLSGMAEEHAPDVDIVMAPRSTGSILKPFLFANMISSGELLPNMLLPDLPVQYGGYVPKNFDETNSGAVPASEALAKSLNIPHVFLVGKHGVSKFHDELRRMGMRTLSKEAKHYGMTIVVGGAESTLWDLNAMYASMARILNQYRGNSSRYSTKPYKPLFYLKNSEPVVQDSLTKQSMLTAASIWHTFEAMQELTRPEDQGFWEKFSSSRRIAWKTGTSFGFRDAWAVGLNPKYVVSVWVGNADGEGRPGLMGITAAAPILFDVFQVLNFENTWFDQPYDDMKRMAICRQSGFQSSHLCPQVDTLWMAKTGEKTPLCPHHKEVFLDAKGAYRVNAECYPVLQMVKKAAFILPAGQEYYYKKIHPTYETLPPWLPACQDYLASQQRNSMDLIYPREGAKIFVPRELDESRGRTIFEVAHRNPEAMVYWHLNGEFITTTKQIHQLALDPPPGPYTLTVVDESGETIVRKFEIVK
jgi:penicillin-binding protein 1C